MLLVIGCIGDRSLTTRPEAAVAGDISLPKGCSVTYDLAVIDMLSDLLRPRTGTDDLEAQYRDFGLRNGMRRRAAELARMGFNPGPTGHGGWFDFVRDMGDAVEPPVIASHGALLRRLERDQTQNGADLRALSAMVAGGTARDDGTRAWALSPLFTAAGDGLHLRRDDPMDGCQAAPNPVSARICSCATESLGAIGLRLSLWRPPGFQNLGGRGANYRHMAPA